MKNLENESIEVFLRLEPKRWLRVLLPEKYQFFIGKNPFLDTEKCETLQICVIFC